MRDWLADALAQPHGVFLESPNGVLTFHELGERVGHWIGGVSPSFQPGTRIGVWARNDLESVTAILAAPRAGLVPLLLDPRRLTDQVDQMLAEAGVQAVAGEGPDVGLPTVDQPGPFAAWAEEVDPSSIHSVVFTSGTGGSPRGVRLTWGNLEASSVASSRHLHHSETDRWLCVLPVCHVGGLSILIRSLRQRSTVLLEPSFDAGRVAHRLDGDATLVSLVTATLRQILDAGGGFSGVRAALVGGGPVPEEIVVEAQDAGLPVLATYGMTETASMVATASMRDPDPVWLERLDGVSLSIVGGRIAVSGAMVSPGYLDGDDFDQPFVTNDEGMVDNGRLRVIGRADDVIVSGGENVRPSHVEEMLRTIDGVVEAAVVGVEDETWGSVVCAAVELDGRAPLPDVEAAARRMFPSFQLPRRWLVVSRLPRLGIGKLDRKAVQQLFQ
jgi:O-succinylbenzoic acid--CoA ligase